MMMKLGLLELCDFPALDDLFFLVFFSFVKRTRGIQSGGKLPSTTPKINSQCQGYFFHFYLIKELITINNNLKSSAEAITSHNCGPSCL